MTGRLTRLLLLFPIYLRLRSDIRRQKSYLASVLNKDITGAKRSDDGTLDEQDFDKIKNYYGFGVPAIVGESFCTLRGKKMSEKERTACTYQGALTGLYDDFFDKTNLTDDQIKSMMNDPFAYQPDSSLEKLFIYFLRKVHEHISDKFLFNKAFNDVFNAQKDSLKQVDPGLSEEKITEITFRKGGFSLLFYRSAFDHPFVEGEKEAIFQLGALMQLGNDIFDVYKDHQQNIRTLLTINKDIDRVRKVFREQMDKSFKSIKKLPYHKRDKLAFLYKISLGISRCYVCLDQLEALQQKNQNIFDPEKHTGKELICDMEQWINMYRSAMYFVKYKI